MYIAYIYSDDDALKLDTSTIHNIRSALSEVANLGIIQEIRFHLRLDLSTSSVPSLCDMTCRVEAA